MTIREATDRGIAKLTLPNWNRYAHIELYLTRETASHGTWGAVPEGTGKLLHGPWVRLYDPCANLALGNKWDHYDQFLSMSCDYDYYNEWFEPTDYHRFEVPLDRFEACP